MRLLSQSLLFLVFSLCSISIMANPQGGVVGAGSAVISTPSSDTTLITQTSNKAIINWQSFNIGQGQTTQFIQPSSSAITLNRINALNGPSAINGNLLANGQIWLINPAGIVFGLGAQVNVGGILATTSNINDKDFLSGNYRFYGVDGYPNGSVVNYGNIHVKPGGLAALIGHSVENKGVIKAKFGQVILGGAQIYTVDFDGDGLINFAIQNETSGNNSGNTSTVSNTGVIDVGAGAIMQHRTGQNIVQNVVNMSGLQEANHVQVKNGVITFDAGGGQVNVSGKMIAHNGNIKIRGGKIAVKKAKINTSSKYGGGSIDIRSTGDIKLVNSVLSANNFGVGTGGAITVLGDTITISGSKLSANGIYGGGRMNIGGNAHGIGNLPSARSTYIDNTSYLSANALLNGDGGNIVIWSDFDTKVAAFLSAKGGVLGGDGGWIETSGGHLAISGIRVNLEAPEGKTGLWLLDPSNITISNGVTDMNFGAGVFSPQLAANDSILNVNDLITQLASANIEVVTTSTGSAAGNITIATPITWSSGNSLTLTADPTTGQVQVNNAITATGNGAGLVLSGQSIAIAAPITTNNGQVSLTGATTISVANAVTTGTGTQTYNSPVTLTDSTTLSGGNITLPAVTLAANTLTIDTSSLSSSVNGIVSGSGGLTKTGTGTVTLNAANTYTGVTNISEGTIALGLNDAIRTTTRVTLANVSGAVLDLNNFNQTLFIVTGGGSSGGNISLGSGTLTLQPLSGSSYSYSGAISGTGNLVFDGPGRTLILGSASSNSYTGTTLINRGQIAINGPNAFGNSPTTQSSSITIADGATLGLWFSGTLTNTNPITVSGYGAVVAAMYGTSNATLNNPINLAGNTKVSGRITMNGVISDNGNNYKLTIGGYYGGGPITLTNANTYGGGTAVYGSLNVRDPNALGTMGDLYFGNGHVTTGDGSVYITIGDNTLQNSSPITIDGGNLRVTQNGVTSTLQNPITLLTTGTMSIASNSNLILSGNISGSAGIKKTNYGTLTLSGTNTYGGSTTIDTGKLVLGASNAIPSLSEVVLSNILGVSLDLNGFSNVIGSLSGGGDVLLGSGTLTTGNNNTNTTFSGTMSGTGNLVKVGTGTQTLAGNNTYSGSTAVNNGTLQVDHVGGLGNTSSTIVEAGATLGFDLNGGTLTNTNPITMNGGSLLDTTAAGTQDTLNNNVILNSTTTITPQIADATLALFGTVSGVGNIDKQGDGILLLAGNNTYSGSTAVNNGTLQVDHVGGLGNTSSTIVEAGATLGFDLNGGTLTNTNPITMNGGSLLDTTAAGTQDTLNNRITFNTSTIVTPQNANATLALLGELSGVSNIIKQGDGNLILANTPSPTVNTFPVIINGNTIDPNLTSYNTVLLAEQHNNNNVEITVENGEVDDANGIIKMVERSSTNLENPNTTLTASSTLLSDQGGISKNAISQGATTVLNPQHASVNGVANLNANVFSNLLKGIRGEVFGSENVAGISHTVIYTVIAVTAASFLLLIYLVLLWIVRTYKNLIGLLKMLQKRSEKIEHKLNERFGKLEFLIAFIKNEVDYEKTFLKDILILRDKAQAYKLDNQQKLFISSESEISKYVLRLDSLFSEYPQLKKNEQGLILNQEIFGLENELMSEKYMYNDNITQFKAMKRTLIGMLLVMLFPHKFNQSFEYWPILNER